MILKNKKGLSTLDMFVSIFFMAFFIVFIGMWLLSFNLIDDALNQNVTVAGDSNLSNINDQTFGQYNKAFVASADLIGIVVILGMIMLMMGNAYAFGARNHKLMMVVDIFILVFVFIFSIYISSTYDTLINSSDLLLNIFQNDLGKSSKFILNLPIYVGTIGALLIIVAYSGFGREDAREVNVLGA